MSKLHETKPVEIVEIDAEELAELRKELTALRNARLDHESRRSRMLELLRKRDKEAKELKATKAAIEALAEEFVTDTFAENLYSSVEPQNDETDEDNAWRAVPIDTLVSFGLKANVVKLLRDAEIETIGQLSDFQADGSWLEKIPGIKSGKSEQLAEALERFWADLACQGGGN